MIPLGPFPLGILCDSAQSPWQHQNSPLSLLSLEVQPIPRLSPATFPLQGSAGQGRTAGREGIRSQAAQDLPWSCWPALITL